MSGDLLELPDPPAEVASDLGRFAMVPVWVIQHAGLSDKAVRLYAALMTYADRNTGEAWPSRKRLADDLATSVNSVDRAMDMLVKAGAVTVENRYGDHGQRSNLYSVRWAPPSPLVGTPPPHRWVAPLPTGGDPPSPLVGNRTRTKEPDHVSDVVVEMAHQWCEITGQTPTRAVVRRLVAPIDEWIKLRGRPTREFMEAAHGRGIVAPQGWGFVSNEDTNAVPAVGWDDLEAAPLPEGLEVDQ